MKACLRSLSRVALVAALVAGVGVTAALAQGEWKAPADAKGTKNPLADTKADKAVLAEGKKLADTNCVPCHGAGGQCGGPGVRETWTTVGRRSEIRLGKPSLGRGREACEDLSVRRAHELLLVVGADPLQ